MNYTDCAGRFFEIREESAAVQGRCSSGGRALSSDRSGDRRCFPAKRSENQTSRMYSFIRDRSLPVNVSLPDVSGCHCGNCAKCDRPGRFQCLPCSETSGVFEVLRQNYYIITHGKKQGMRRKVPSQIVTAPEKKYRTGRRFSLCDTFFTGSGMNRFP